MFTRSDRGFGSQFIRAYTTRDDDWTREAPGTLIPFTASTGATAKDRMALKPDRWRVDNYHRSGGPVLWQHDHSRPAIGNGKATVEPKRLRIHAVFDQEDEFARAIESKLRRRVLRSSSVGWCFVDHSGEVLANQRISPYVIENQAFQSLDEMSIVNVGSDPFAVAERAAATRYALQRIDKRFADLYDAMERTDSDVTEPEIRAAIVDYCRHLGLEFTFLRGTGYDGASVASAKPVDDDDDDERMVSEDDDDDDAQEDTDDEDGDDEAMVKPSSLSRRGRRSGLVRRSELPSLLRAHGIDPIVPGGSVPLPTAGVSSVDTRAADVLLAAFGGLGR